MSHAERRILLIGKIAETYRKAIAKDKEIDEDLLIATLGAEEGIARRTAREYIVSAKLIAGVKE